MLCSDAYGSMLWNLGSPTAEQYFKCWNTSVKLVYGVPRSTYTYLVEGFFASNFTSLRNQILSRYPGFFRKLLHSPSREVRFLAHLVQHDPRSVTCTNLRYLRRISSLEQAELYSSTRVRCAVPVLVVPEKESWRLGLLTQLMVARSEKFFTNEDSKSKCAMLDSLCNS